MTASDWAAWVGAVTGVGALGWEVVRWFREGPRLLVRAQPDMVMMPDADGRPILMVYVANVGTVPTTLTSFVGWQFDSRIARWRVRPARAWVAVHDPNLGPPLPRVLAPGEQWTGGVRQDEALTADIVAGRQYLGIYHAMDPLRPVLVRVSPALVARKD